MGYIGFHASISGGLHNAIDEAVAAGAEAVQIFTANQRMWKVKTPDAGDVKLFLEKRRKSGIRYAVTHDSYLINLASVNPDILAKSRMAFSDEIKRSSMLGIDHIIFHPGSHTGGTHEQGITNIVTSLKAALKELPKGGPMLLLEATAGSGSHIGGRFEELAAIIKKLKRHPSVGICFDTAHVFEAGYDLKNNYDEVFNEFDKICGMDRIKVFHINDSKTVFGSHADRHQHIGRGELGEKFFAKLMRDSRFKELPMILETPDEDGMDAVNIKLLKKLRSSR
ncbi:MAG TPA: deoxyribonuclease IV [bacterium]|nr:deoxyribonuclease IV [bacterium]